MAVVIFAVALCSWGTVHYSVIYISCGDIPDGVTLHLLVQVDESDPYYADDFSEVTQTADEKRLYNYCEDGFRSAEYFTSLNKNDLGCYDEAELYKYIRHFRYFRVAAADDEGCVTAVSETADMTPDGKAFFYTSLDYSFADGTLAPSGGEYYAEAGIVKRFAVYMIAIFFSDILLLSLIIAVIAARRYGKRHRRLVYVFVFALLSVGNVLFTAEYIFTEVLPKYDYTGDGLTVSDVKTLLMINGAWLIDLAVFIAVRCLPERRGSVNERR